MRDRETAEIAVQASMTGHLVLSTVHTNSAVGAVTRLVDMGVDAYLLASSLVGVLAQRLLRTLCPHCKAPYSADGGDLRRAWGSTRQTSQQLFRAVGCDAVPARLSRADRHLRTDQRDARRVGSDPSRQRVNRPLTEADAQGSRAACFRTVASGCWTA